MRAHRFAAAALSLAAALPLAAVPRTAPVSTVPAGNPQRRGYRFGSIAKL